MAQNTQKSMVDRLRATLAKALDRTVPLEERVPLLNDLLSASVVLHQAHKALVQEIIPELRRFQVSEASPVPTPETPVAPAPEVPVVEPSAAPAASPVGIGAGVSEHVVPMPGHWHCGNCLARHPEEAASQITNKCPACGSVPISWVPGPIPGQALAAVPVGAGEAITPAPAATADPGKKKRGRPKKTADAAPQGACAPVVNGVAHNGAQASLDLALELQQEIDTPDSVIDKLRPPRPTGADRKDTSLDYYSDQVACDGESCGASDVIIRLPQDPGDVRVSYRCRVCDTTGYFDASEDEAKALRESGKPVNYQEMLKAEDKAAEKPKKKKAEKKEEKPPESPVIETAKNELDSVETDAELVQKVKAVVAKESEALQTDTAAKELRAVVAHWTPVQVVAEYERLTNEKADPKMPQDVLMDVIVKRMLTATGSSIF